MEKQQTQEPFSSQEKPMRMLTFTIALLLASPSGVPARVADLTKIDRTIAKEPAYKSKPKLRRPGDGHRRPVRPGPAHHRPSGQQHPDDNYWESGRRIVEFEQGGEARAEYGETDAVDGNVQLRTDLFVTAPLQIKQPHDRPLARFKAACRARSSSSFSTRPCIGPTRVGRLAPFAIPVSDLPLFSLTMSID
jgi:hypothetical protein